MNICDTNLFGNGLLYVTFNQDQGKLNGLDHLNKLVLFRSIFSCLLCKIKTRKLSELDLNSERIT